MKVKFLIVCAMASVLAVACGNKKTDSAADNGETATEQQAPEAASAQSEDNTPADLSAEKRNSSSVIELENDNVLRRGRPVGRTAVIDFNATWCMPCKKFEPAFNEVAQQVSGVDFISVDIEKCPQTAASFGIQSVPTLLIIAPDGTIKDDYIGIGELLPAENFLKIVKANI